MEPAKIDWKNLEWRFVEDELYEHINAPKWFDFSSHDSHPNDDDAWFCRPDCNHPKTAQDFLKSTPPSKLASPINAFQRDSKSKSRVSPTSNTSKFGSDSENQNPNQSTPPSYKIFKAAMKSSAENKEARPDNEAVLPRLKSTLSGRNLFVGRDILSQITDFCNDLKRMAMKPKEDPRATVQQRLEVLGERKPLKPQRSDTTSVLKENKIRITRNEDSENIPITVNLEKVKNKDENLLLQIRTNPPSPQCFTATKKGTPSKSKLMERGVLQDQNKQVLFGDKNKCVSSSSIVESKEAKPLDVFWFLKPCTLSNYNNS